MIFAELKGACEKRQCPVLVIGSRQISFQLAQMAPWLRQVNCHEPFGINNHIRTISLSKTPVGSQPFGSIGERMNKRCIGLNSVSSNELIEPRTITLCNISRVRYHSAMEIFYVL